MTYVEVRCVLLFAVFSCKMFSSFDADLLAASAQAQATGSLTPILKKELWLKIQTRRLLEGKEELVLPTATPTTYKVWYLSRSHSITEVICTGLPSLVLKIFRFIARYFFLFSYLRFFYLLFLVFSSLFVVFIFIFPSFSLLSLIFLLFSSIQIVYIFYHQL